MLKDTGLGSGTAMGAAVWLRSESLESWVNVRVGFGMYTDWQVTGTGLEKIAMGAEPALVNLGKRLGSATGLELSDTS